MKPFKISDIRSYIDLFPDTQYYPEAFPKKQIILHHTVSGGDALGDINWWKSSTERVATCIITDREGIHNQCFSTKYWAHHIGLKTSSNEMLNKRSIAIEIDNWGGLKRKNNKWYSFPDDYNKVIVPDDKVQLYPNGFRGFEAFEKYTDVQIESLASLLVYLSRTYNIPLTYSDKIWDINKEALNGDEGVFTHVSYRSDKSDCHPQPNLIEMLKKLSTMSQADKDLIWKK